MAIDGRSLGNEAKDGRSLGGKAEDWAEFWIEADFANLLITKYVHAQLQSL